MGAMVVTATRGKSRVVKQCKRNGKEKYSIHFLL